MKTVQQFAESINISKPIIDAWIYRYGLPVIKIGRRNYIDDNDYSKWIEEHKTTITKTPTFVIPITVKPARGSGITSKIRRIY